MSVNWEWVLTHQFLRKKHYPSSAGGVTNSVLKNVGEVPLHIYGIGIEFGWQWDTGVWWYEKCDLMVKPKESVVIPDVEFFIPLNIKPGEHKYRIGIETKYLEYNVPHKPVWIDHGIVYVKKMHYITISSHPGRKYNVFISHSNHHDDKILLKELTDLLQYNGIECFVAEEAHAYGENLWKKIREGIRKADRVIFLWTKHGAKSGDVREELGITVGSRRKFVPLIEKVIKPKGSLIGTEHCRFERAGFMQKIEGLTDTLIDLSDEKKRKILANKRKARKKEKS